MKSPSEPVLKPTRAELAHKARQEAKAAALRANLARRKEQARAKPEKVKDNTECP